MEAFAVFRASPIGRTAVVAVQDDSGVGVWWLEFQFGEGCPGGLSIEAAATVASPPSTGIPNNLPVGPLASSPSAFRVLVYNRLSIVKLEAGTWNHR